MKHILKMTVLLIALSNSAQAVTLDTVCGKLQVKSSSSETEVWVYRVLDKNSPKGGIRISGSDHESLNMVSALKPNSKTCLQGYRGKTVGKDQLFFPVRVASVNE